MKNISSTLIGPISFTLGGAEVLCISGPSGCGKSMLCRCLADLEEHQGEMVLDGNRSTSMSAPQWRRKVALLATDSHWWNIIVGHHFDLSMQDFLVSGLTSLGFTTETLDWRIDRMSSGEKQRLAIIRLLQNRPQVILLDEPTSNLDPDSVKKVEKYLLDYQQSTHCAMLWITHDQKQIARVASQHVVMNAGKWESIDVNC